MLGYGLDELSGGVVAGAAGENVGDLIMGGQKSLHLPRRLEPLHDPFPSSRRLVGILGSIIEALLLQVRCVVNTGAFGSGFGKRF
jgi:hypothetical protein